MKFSKSLLASGLLVATGVAQAELSGNLGVSSNYYFRGVTQTDDKAAVSGGLDWGHESGFYVGTWASNVDFGGKEDMEVDLYAGFGGDIGDSGFNYDLSVWYYWYPGAGGDQQGGDLDYTEISGSLGWEWITATIAYTVDSETDEDVPFAEDDIYYGLSADLPVDIQGFTPSVFIGYYDFDADGTDLDGDGIDDDASYTHWGIGLSKDAGDFGSFSLTYEQTDGDEDDAVATDENPNFWIGWAKDF
jgi:uncharacterized protein (TIGR02001 family)